MENGQTGTKQKLSSMLLSLDVEQQKPLTFSELILKVLQGLLNVLPEALQACGSSWRVTANNQEQAFYGSLMADGYQYDVVMTITKKGEMCGMDDGSPVSFREASKPLCEEHSNSGIPNEELLSCYSTTTMNSKYGVLTEKKQKDLVR